MLVASAACAAQNVVFEIIRAQFVKIMNYEN